MTQLVWRYHVRGREIAVVTLYEGQRLMIEQQLREKGLTEVTTQTVYNSQGQSFKCLTIVHKLEHVMRQTPEPMTQLYWSWCQCKGFG